MKEVVVLTLYNRHGYLNKDIPFIISNEIIEYDMVSAGLNLTKKYGLLDPDTISHLERLPKAMRNVQMGLIQKKDREYTKNLQEAFVQGRKLFFEANDLNVDNVLSIKKDAIYTMKTCDVLEFDGLEFSPKNAYTSYYYLNGYEFYYNREGIDVKGIDDTKLELHSEYMLGAIYDYMYLQENNTRSRVIKYIRDLARHYKRKEMEIGYYRELNNESLFRLNIDVLDTEFGVEYTDDKNSILINYNFNNYIIPLTRILL